MSLSPMNMNTNIFCNPMPMGMNPMMGGFGAYNNTMMSMNGSILPFMMMGGMGGCGCGYPGRMDKATQVLLGTTIGLSLGSSEAGQTLGGYLGKGLALGWDKGIKPGAVWTYNNAIKPAWDWTVGLFNRNKV